MNISKYLVDVNDVRNWDSQDQLVADNLNRICRALDLRIYPILIVGWEPRWDPKLYDEIMSHVRDTWISKERLLNLTDEQIIEYVESRAAIYGIPLLPPPIVDNVEIMEAQCPQCANLPKVPQPIAAGK